MIKKRDRIRTPKMDKSTLCMLKALARHNRDAELNAYIADIVENYIQEIRGGDVIRPEETMLIDREKYSMICPCCGELIDIDMEAIEK